MPMQMIMTFKRNIEINWFFLNNICCCCCFVVCYCCCCYYLLIHVIKDVVRSLLYYSYHKAIKPFEGVMNNKDFKCFGIKLFARQNQGSRSVFDIGGWFGGASTPIILHDLVSNSLHGRTRGVDPSSTFWDNLVTCQHQLHACAHRGGVRGMCSPQKLENFAYLKLNPVIWWIFLGTSSEQAMSINTQFFVPD